MDRWPWRWTSELLYAAYCSYYFMIGGVGLALLLRNRQQFTHFISIVSFVFYVCYAIYIFTPVVAAHLVPRHCGYALPPDVIPATTPVPPEAVAAGIFFQIMKWIYERFENPGAAFPAATWPWR